MSDSKSKLERIKEKIYNREREEKVEEAIAQIDEELPNDSIDIYEYKPGRFKVALLRYDPNEPTKAYTEKVVQVKDTYRQVAMRFKNDKASLKQLLLKGKKK